MERQVPASGPGTVAVVGGGMLGLTLALRLAQKGRRVSLFEAGPALGGLACGQDYGDFTWDRFYHVILPQDRHLIRLVQELGLGQDLRWRRTGTGYYADGRFYDMNGSLDWLRFPLLSMLDKARLGLLTVHATRVARPEALHGITAEAWLRRICGERGYRVFWQPLLRAKFGPYHDQVAAVFIWATLTRLFGARSGAASAEQMGYVRGGYARILARMEQVLTRRFRVQVHTSSPVQEIRPTPGGEPPGCLLRWRGPDGVARQEPFSQVLFTAPTSLARRVVSAELLPVVRRAEEQHPASAAYLGVACLVLTLPRPLTRYYVLNIGDERVELTGLVEMTTLVNRHAETGGLSLIYLPRYMASDDPRFDLDDEALAGPMIERGLQRLLPGFRRRDARYLAVHRARFVQPLPLVRAAPPPPQHLPRLQGPFQVLNTSMLTCATLNNNEVVRLAGELV